MRKLFRRNKKKTGTKSLRYIHSSEKRIEKIIASLAPHSFTETLSKE